MERAVANSNDAVLAVIKDSVMSPPLDISAYEIYKNAGIK
jgi:hypothetical protein